MDRPRLKLVFTPDRQRGLMRPALVPDTSKRRQGPGSITVTEWPREEDSMPPEPMV